MTSFKPLQIVTVSKSFLYLCPLRSDARLHLLTPGRFPLRERIALYLWKSPRRPPCSYRHQKFWPRDAAFQIRGTNGGQKWNTKKVICLIYNKLLSSSKSCIGKARWGQYFSKGRRFTLTLSITYSFSPALYVRTVKPDIEDSQFLNGDAPHITILGKFEG